MEAARPSAGRGSNSVFRSVDFGQRVGVSSPFIENVSKLLTRIVAVMWATMVFALAAVIVWLVFEREIAAASLFALAALVLVSSLLYATGPERYTALRTFTYGANKKIEKGADVPEEARNDPGVRLDVHYTVQRGAFFRGLFLGEDGRWSTSKLQVLIWTYTIIWALATILFADAMGEAAGFDRVLDADVDLWGPYLVLLGGPFAAYVLAKGVTSSAVAGGAAKTASEPTTNVREGLNQVVSDDRGDTDIVDLQYFLFNLLALSYFLFRFLPDVGEGLPELPSMLVALTGASAATYVGKKIAEQETPSITAVFPAKVSPGSALELWGRSLLLAERGRRAPKPRVSIGPVEVPEGELEIVEDLRAAPDHLRVRVPTGIAAGAAKVRVVTAAGVSAEAMVEIG